MKKTYIQPSIEAVNIQLSHMVMTSDDVTGTSIDPNATPINTMQRYRGRKYYFDEFDDE